MILSTDVIDVISWKCGINISTVKWYYRMLAQKNMIPVGKRGPGGHKAKISSRDISTLIVSILSFDGARKVAESTSRICDFRLEKCINSISFRDRLALKLELPHIIPVLEKNTSVSVIRNDFGIEYAKITYNHNNSEVFLDALADVEMLPLNDIRYFSERRVISGSTFIALNELIKSSRQLSDCSVL